jgi:hypothetical protein
MGKTLPPCSQLIDGERRRWLPLKKALPKADHAIFERLFDGATLHTQAGVMMSRPWPCETMVMAILLCSVRESCPRIWTCNLAKSVRIAPTHLNPSLDHHLLLAMMRKCLM